MRNIELLTEVLEDAFGVAGWDDSAKDTARRVLKYWAEFRPPAEFLFDFTTFPADHSQMIVVRDIEFTSLCGHHLLPIIGKAHVGYIANELQVGLSKIPRLVDFWAKRPQTQERLGAQIARDLKERLKPIGVIVVLEARHTCTCARGVQKVDGVMQTSLPLGIFLSSGDARKEFFDLISRRVAL